MTATLSALTVDDFDALTQLAHAIWQECFVPLIGAPQVNYMTAWRYDAADWASDLNADHRGCAVARVDGRPVGFLRWRLAPGDALKVVEVYLHADVRGTGLVDTMLAHAESVARAHGRTLMVLTVNRQNDRAVAAYARNGYTIAALEDFDIGGGFLCHDFRMEKRLR